MNIVILDFEASGLSESSFPIQVAYNIGYDIKSFYINPESVDGWDYWDEEAEKVHGLSREFLLNNGMQASEVVKIMKGDLDGMVVYSDAPDFESMWCEALFYSQGLELNFNFKNIINRCFIEKFGRDYNIPYGSEEILFIDEFRNRVSQYFEQYQNVRQHDAGSDVKAIMYAFETLT